MKSAFDEDIQRFTSIRSEMETINNIKNEDMKAVTGRAEQLEAQIE